MPWWAKWHGETLDMASIKRDIIAARVSRFIPANLLHRVAWYAMPLRNATTGLFAGLRITWVYWPKVIDERIYRESKSPKAFRNRRLA